MVNEFSINAPGVSVISDIDDDEDETPGRILSDEEFVARIRNRTDIFCIEDERQIAALQFISIFCAVITGLYLNKIDLVSVQVATGDFYDGLSRQISGKLSQQTVDLPPEMVKVPPKKVVNVDASKLHLSKKTAKNSSGEGPQGGGGDIHSRVTKKGVLGILSGQIEGKSVQGDIQSIGGFATGLDAIISGKASLKHGNGVGFIRKGEAGIGFGNGYSGSGFGENGNGVAGIDDLMKSEPDLELTKRPLQNLAVKVNMLPGSGSLTGGRSRTEIARVVLQNMQSLRYAYNKRLRDKPGLQGKITCKFAIDEFGNVLSCNVIESSIHDEELETVINTIILRWRFGKIDKPGDITEIIYPFVFSS